MNKLTEFKEVRHIPELLMPWVPGEEKLEDGVLYVVDHEEQKEQYVEYNCPCGCGNVVWIPYYKQGQQKEEYPIGGCYGASVSFQPSAVPPEPTSISHWGRGGVVQGWSFDGMPPCIPGSRTNATVYILWFPLL